MMKKITLEKLLLAVFGIILGYVLFGHIENPYAILYNAISYLWMCGMFVYTGLIWIGEPEKKKKHSFYIWSYIALSVGGWVFVNFFLVLYYEHLAGDPIYLLDIFHPYYMDNYLESLLPGTIIGFIYGYFRRLIRSGNGKKLKKVIGWSSAAIVTSVVFIRAIYLYDLSYQGNKHIQFLDKDQQFTSLEEVLSQPELQGKKIYVDFWYATCSPCIKAFKNMKPGKELLKEQDYVTLFMGRETSHPDSKVRWISTISDYELEGYHVYMSEQLEEEIFNLLMKYEDLYLAYPHYFIVDENGNITDWDAPGITEVTALEESLNKTIASKNN